MLFYISSIQIFWNMVMNFTKTWSWQLKKYLHSVIDRPIHVLFASMFDFQNVENHAYQYET